jgi:hypothetical protein
MTVNQLKRWRDYGRYKDPRRKGLSTDDLDTLLQGLTENRPERGERTIQGRLLGAQIKVTRSDLRSSMMHRVGVAMRY